MPYQSPLFYVPRLCPRCACGKPILVCLCFCLFCFCLFYFSFLVKFLGCFINWPLHALRPCPRCACGESSFLIAAFFKALRSNCVYSLGLLHTVSSKNWLPPSPLVPYRQPTRSCGQCTHSHKHIRAEEDKNGRLRVWLK